MANTFVSIDPEITSRVSTDSSITITYSFDSGASGFDTDTIITNNIIFEETSLTEDEEPVSFSVTTATSDTQIVINPSSSLSNNVVYEIILSSNITDDNAVAITEKTFRFITEIEDETPTVSLSTDGNANKAFRTSQQISELLDIRKIVKEGSKFNYDFIPTTYDPSDKTYSKEGYQKLSIDNQTHIKQLFQQQHLHEFDTFLTNIKSFKTVTDDEFLDVENSIYPNAYDINISSGLKKKIEFLVKIYANALEKFFIAVTEDPVQKFKYHISTDLGKEHWIRTIKEMVHPIGWRDVYTEIDALIVDTVNEVIPIIQSNQHQWDDEYLIGTVPANTLTGSDGSYTRHTNEFITKTDLSGYTIDEFIGKMLIITDGVNPGVYTITGNTNSSIKNTIEVAETFDKQIDGSDSTTEERDINFIIREEMEGFRSLFSVSDFKFLDWVADTHFHHMSKIFINHTIWEVTSSSEGNSGSTIPDFSAKSLIPVTWVSELDVSVGDVIHKNNSEFIATTAGTTDTSEINWTLIDTKSADTDTWSADTEYKENKVIYDSVDSFWIVQTAGTSQALSANEPNWSSKTIGNTIVDNTVTWKKIVTGNIIADGTVQWTKQRLTDNELTWTKRVYEPRAKYVTTSYFHPKPPLKTWASITEYNKNYRISETTTNYTWVVSTSGTSDSSEPTWADVDTITDGTVVWRRELWTSNTDYALNDIITEDGSDWICIDSGTSDVSIEPTWTGKTVTDNTVIWKNLSWSSEIVYTIGDQIEGGDSSWEVVTRGKSGTSEPTWTGNTVTENSIVWRRIESKRMTDGNYPGSLYYHNWLASTIYTTGDVVFEDGSMWEVVTPGISSSTEPSWAGSVSIGGSISDNTVVWKRLDVLKGTTFNDLLGVFNDVLKFKTQNNLGINYATNYQLGAVDESISRLVYDSYNDLEILVVRGSSTLSFTEGDTTFLYVDDNNPLMYVESDTYLTTSFVFGNTEMANQVTEDEAVAGSISYDIATLSAVELESGTTTGSTTDATLVDTSATFITNGVKIGDTVNNTSDSTSSTVMSVTNETTLTVSADIFPTVYASKNYNIKRKNNLQDVTFDLGTVPTEIFVGSVVVPTGTNPNNDDGDGYEVWSYTKDTIRIQNELGVAETSSGSIKINTPARFNVVTFVIPQTFSYEEAWWYGSRLFFDLGYIDDIDFHSTDRWSYNYSEYSAEVGYTTTLTDSFVTSDMTVDDRFSITTEGLTNPTRLFKKYNILDDNVNQDWVEGNRIYEFEPKSSGDYAYEIIESGSSDGSSSYKLEDSSATFTTNGVLVGDLVTNTVDSTTATVTSVDSETVLSIDVDIFDGGIEGYKVEKLNDVTDYMLCVNSTDTFITDGVVPGDIVTNTDTSTSAIVEHVISEIRLQLDTAIFPSKNESYIIDSPTTQVGSLIGIVSKNEKAQTKEMVIGTDASSVTLDYDILGYEYVQFYNTNNESSTWYKNNQASTISAGSVDLTSGSWRSSTSQDTLMIAEFFDSNEFSNSKYYSNTKTIYNKQTSSGLESLSSKGDNFNEERDYNRKVTVTYEYPNYGVYDWTLVSTSTLTLDTINKNTMFIFYGDSTDTTVDVNLTLAWGQVTISTTGDLSFGSVANTITRTEGSWITDGVTQGDYITISGSVINDGTYIISSGGVAATVLTVEEKTNTELIVGGLSINSIENGISIYGTQYDVSANLSETTTLLDGL